MMHKFRLFRWTIHSVKSKLILAFAIILIIPSLAIGLVSFTTAKNKVSNQMERTASASVNLLDQLITQMIEFHMKNIDFLSQEIITGRIGLEKQDYEDPSVREILNKFIKLHPELEAVFVGTDKGGSIGSPVIDLPSDYDARNRPWYTQAMENKGKVVITDTYESMTSKNPTVFISKALNDGHGVVGISLSLKSLSENVLGVKIGRQGYVIVADESRNWIVHPTQKPGSKLEKTTADPIYHSAAGTLNYINPYDGKAKKMIFITNPLTGWKVMGTWYQNELKQEAVPIFNMTITVITVSLLLGTAVAFLIIRSLPSPQLERKYQILYKLSPLPILLVDQKAAIHDANPAARKLFDLSASEILGLDFSSLLAPNDRYSFQKQLESCSMKNSEYMINTSLQEKRLVSMESEFIIVDGQQLQYIILRDITESRNAEQQMAYLAYHDELTGLYNRNMFHRQLNEALTRLNEEDSSIAVILMDLDHFKMINDTMGHHVGDLVLQHVAKQLVRHTPADMNLARLGGDEFAMFMSGVDNEVQLHYIGMKILNGLKNPFVYDNRTYQLTASLGICLAPEFGTNSSELLMKADIAMYDAKSKGKDCCQIYTQHLMQSN